MTRPTHNPDTLATAYDLARADGTLRLTPLRHAGPGRTARFALLAGALLGTAALVGYVLAARHFQDRIARNPLGQPVWLPWVCPAGILLPIALLAFAGCAKLARTLRTPLAVERGGPVRYGAQLLVAEGNVDGVRVERESCRVTPESGPSYEQKTAYVYLATRDGAFVELPAPYFSNLDGWEVAESLGAALALQLGVPLSYEAPPPEHSTPASRARLGSRVFGCVALVIGAAHFLAGFGLFVVLLAARVDPAIRPPADAPPIGFALIFVASGSGAGYLGIRLWGGTRRGWLLLLAVLAAVVVSGLLALRAWG
jgi:hypothetical protein